ncbi:MAG: PEP-CTERM sorting domain-containing protein [Planctomycetota bacterium]|nr:MAG: PEP-CTERM sorting domain-containing protein [Planctomycetota bacterium]
MRGKTCAVWVALLWFGVCACPLEANMVFPLEIIDCAARCCDSPDLNMYVEVIDGGQDQVDFTFYNDSLISSSVARIYFDDDSGLLSGVAGIDGLGVSFVQSTSPLNLPGVGFLDPPFDATSDFGFAVEHPLPANGINPGQWAKITFDMACGRTLYDVIDALDTGTLRAGVRVLTLPEGLFSSAVTVPAPEPATLLLFGTAGMWLLTRKRRSV